MTAAYVAITELQRLAAQSTSSAQMVERRLEALRVRDGFEIHDTVIERAIYEARSSSLEASARLAAILDTVRVAS